MLVHMLLFNINKKAYVGSPFVQLHLTLIKITQIAKPYIS